ncbi:uncharacterized protein LOC128964477 [Oppia nitens]|uniref:uncharacterized protein LOC128964477 n=1 Tax=Oppia nitens TaxID=1686743 RepID=UPI0023DCAE2F|nr:uncharacterized protein LOC128964477 [Oppia nitens]XP_054167049.1 uncharacterized protein LOC128964477 [Oppia nitens]XP_054167050.1 uncharacterized protein LOC128964477 [Oppia nitens]
MVELDSSQTNTSKPIETDILDNQLNGGTDDVSHEEPVDSITNKYLFKLCLPQSQSQPQQQQKVMALHNNNDNNITCSQQNSRNINIESDRFWFDQNVENCRNQNKVNLSALKHDHPLIASAVDNMGHKSGLCSNESILVASLPPSEPQTLSLTAQQFDTTDYSCDKKSLCIPYGYCYDDEKLSQSQSQLSLNIPDLKSPLSITNDSDSDWMCDSTNVYYNGVNVMGYSYNIDNMENEYNLENVFQVDKADIKTGPTLAQLNASLDAWDNIDLDELLDSAQMDSKYRSKFGYNNGQRVNTNLAINSLDHEYDPKLQENIEYLISYMKTPINNVNTTPLLSQTVTANSKPLLNPSLNTITIQPQTVYEVTPSTSKVSQISATINNNDNSNGLTMNSISNNCKSTVLGALLGGPTGKQKIITNEKAQPMPQTSSTVISQTKPMINGEVLTRVRNNSISTEYSASSHDEGFGSQPEDSDNEEDMDSDDESFYGDYDASDLLGATTSDDANNKWSLNMGRSRKGGEKRYFWQYNVQSKGPKGTRIASVEETSDPHIFNEISDPVFAPDCQVEGVKHSGKARRGDGNDLTPNPRKLLMIGLELKKLSKIINDLTPVAEVPVSSRGKSRKEKNKLASRACRLKKKAQHEANKIKLFGLQMEHKRFMALLIDAKKIIRNYAQNQPNGDTNASKTLENLIKQKGSNVFVAGKTSEFVNHILDNVAAGITNGGLDKV